MGLVAGASARAGSSAPHPIGTLPAGASQTGRRRPSSTPRRNGRPRGLAPRGHARTPPGRPLTAVSSASGDGFRPALTAATMHAMGMIALYYKYH